METLTKFRQISLLLCLLALSACEEQFDLDLDDFARDGIVFNGWVTNENPPYFFYLTKPGPVVQDARDDGFLYESINNATILMTNKKHFKHETYSSHSTMHLYLPALAQLSGQ